MIIALSIFGYFVLGFLWVFYSIAYAPDDVALAFYDDSYRDSIDHGWILMNILFWPATMGLLAIWLLESLFGGRVVKRILDKRFGK